MLVYRVYFHSQDLRLIQSYRNEDEGNKYREVTSVFGQSLRGYTMWLNVNLWGKIVKIELETLTRAYKS